MEDDNIKRINKKIKVLVIALILLIIAIPLGPYLMNRYYDYRNDKDYKIPTDEKTLYDNAVFAYGEYVSQEVLNYMNNNFGDVPTWDDIKDTLGHLEDDITCDVTINYNGTVCLENCVVKGNSYTLMGRNYGEKLSEPNENNKTDGKIYFYVSNDGGYLLNSSLLNDDDYFKLVYTYNCENKDCVGFDASSNSAKALIYDGEYYYYDYKTNNKKKINLDKKDYRSIRIIDSKKKDYGLAIYNRNDDNYMALFNLDLNKFITDFEYESLYSYEVDEILDNNLFAVGNDENKIFLIDNTTGEVKKIFTLAYGLTSMTINGEIFYSVASGSMFDGWLIYNSNYELFNGKNKPYEYGISDDNKIVLHEMNEKTKFYVYDLKGNLLHTSKEYQEIVLIAKGYVIVLDKNNDLKVIDSNENVLTTFMNVTTDYNLHPIVSGWRTFDGKTGIFMQVENKNIPFGTSGSGIRYYYNPETKETSVEYTEGIGGYGKPVLYLYPKKKTKVSVSFQKPELLTTTYPKFNNSWNVTVYPNGNMYDNNNKYYYGLYWEEEGSTEVDFSQGFYVTKDKAIDFLEEKLAKIGLTARESNEFIMYWLPILEQNEKNLVYFELTEEREKCNKLKINPTPDSLLRVAIHVKKVDSYVNIKEQKLTTFKRNGFVAVEWGGVIH